MIKLPFVVQPRVKIAEVGNEETGVLKFPAESSLRVSEDAYFTQVKENTPDTFIAVASLAMKISQGEGISPGDGYKAITTSDDDSYLDIRLKYAKDIVEMNRAIATSIFKQKVAGVTAIMSRLADLVSSQESNADEQRDLFRNWTEDQTSQMSLALIEEVYKFFVREQNGGKDPEPIETPSEEDIKKTQSEADKKQSKQTGRKSSGESNGTGPMTPGSAMKTLEPVA